MAPPKRPASLEPLQQPRRSTRLTDAQAGPSKPPATPTPVPDDDDTDEPSASRSSTSEPFSPEPKKNRPVSRPARSGARQAQAAEVSQARSVKLKAASTLTTADLEAGYQRVLEMTSSPDLASLETLINIQKFNYIIDDLAVTDKVTPMRAAQDILNSWLNGRV